MFERITARVSALINGVLSDGHDQEYLTARPQTSRAPEDFKFCATGGNVAAVGGGYEKVREELRKLALEGAPSKIIRGIVISKN